MRRQEDRDPAVDEVADDLPHGPAAARVQAGGRLVEEDDPRVADQGHREVETATRATGVGDSRLPSLFDQVESLEQLGGPALAFAPFQMAQVGHEAKVLLAGQEGVHRGKLPGDPDHVAHRVGLARHVVTGDAGIATVGADQRGQDLHRRRLAGTVWTEQGEDRPLGDVQVDAVERRLLAERLAQAGCLQRRSNDRGGHASPFPAAFAKERRTVMSP
jgi:hypothetical protein